LAPAPVRNVAGICVLHPRSLAPVLDNSDRFTEYFFEFIFSMCFICDDFTGNAPSLRYWAIAFLPYKTSLASFLNFLTASCVSASTVLEAINAPYSFVKAYMSGDSVLPRMSFSLG